MTDILDAAIADNFEQPIFLVRKICRLQIVCDSSSHEVFNVCHGKPIEGSHSSPYRIYDLTKTQDVCDLTHAISEFVFNAHVRAGKAAMVQAKQKLNPIQIEEQTIEGYSHETK